MHILTLVQEIASHKEHGTSHVALPWGQSWHQPTLDDLMLSIEGSRTHVRPSVGSSLLPEMPRGYNTDHALQVAHRILPHAHPEQVAVRFLVRGLPPLHLKFMLDIS
jgi:hypothetical protein